MNFVVTVSVVCIAFPDKYEALFRITFVEHELTNSITKISSTCL